MSKLRVHFFGLSLDGCGAGPNQSVDDPLGVGGLALVQWMFATRAFHTVHGQEGGATGPDDEFVARGFHNIGAWIMGRNMFGPVRGPWPDDSWKGWWGDTPPFHTPVFVLTHHPRESLTMKGGTVFHFVTEGIRHALEQAREAANEKDVRLGGGIGTVRDYLRAGLVDEMYLAYAPVLLGSGESLWTDLDLPSLGYLVAGHTATENCVHVEITRKEV